MLRSSVIIWIVIFVFSISYSPKFIFLNFWMKIQFSFSKDLILFIKISLLLAHKVFSLISQVFLLSFFNDYH